MTNCSLAITPYQLSIRILTVFIQYFRQHHNQNSHLSIYVNLALVIYQEIGYLRPSLESHQWLVLSF